MSNAPATDPKPDPTSRAKRPARRPKPIVVDGVLIVGGGYAGVHAARAARDAGVRATVIDPTGRHDFVTRLAAVAGGTAPARDASAPLDEFADDVILGRMASADDGSVTLDDGRTYAADALVIGAGSVPTKPPIDGLSLARPLRTADDALALRDEIANAEAVVIVGGGATGVQVAGAVATRHRGIAITLIEVADSLLSGMGAATGRDAARILRQRGVDVRLGTGIDSIDTDGVWVSGDHVAGLPVWAAGFTARAGEFGLPTDGTGSVVTDEHLRVAGWKRTFACGDIARHADHRGVVLPMSAQVAVQAGDAAGTNAVRLLEGRPLRRADVSHAGWVLDLGGSRGLAEFGPVALTAPFLDLVPPLLHWAIDLKHLIDTRGANGLALRPGC